MPRLAGRPNPNRLVLGPDVEVDYAYYNEANTPWYLGTRCSIQGCETTSGGSDGGHDSGPWYRVHAPGHAEAYTCPKHSLELDQIGDQNAEDRK